VVNGALRRFLRERDALVGAATRTEACRLCLPDWWIARLRAAWPADSEALMADIDARSPMTLRVNRRRTDTRAYLALLAAAGIEASATGSHAIRLARARPARSLPGFDDGLVSVQDLGAQCAVPLLAPADGMRVLDACAAPGGKAAHVLEIAECELTALDRDATRLQAVDATLARLGLTATLKAAEAATPSQWWDGRPFDRVLLDAPCTASGVVRRHPDGKWLKRESDMAALVALQSRLLAALWQVLRPGGKLLYATCSVFPDENARQSAGFLTSRPDAKQLPLDLPVAHRDGQLLPDRDHDGFYYALFEKLA
jgi:16S rRNA (cytosine967-C5)-methyltransferase